ncbi:MAG TPA: TfpX/TfpZ family type IV pilin accessory protein [Steroidobacteraceae bacterium]|nr:TfpX/TfpZ family type IV pilin accessory protein [Steroidobacteraceae bacterium]
MAINWRERFIAAAIHFLITLALAGVAAALVFLVWFPGALAEMVGGTKLFTIIVGVDVALGPLISLVIYSSQKSRRELVTDYTVVGIVQIAALVYGVFTLAVSRPVFVTFVGDRLEVVAALELDEADLAAAPLPQFRTRSWTGPRLAAIEMPTDARERNEVVMLGMAGKDVQMLPRYYRPYESALADIQRRAGGLDALLQANPEQRERIEAAIDDTGVPRENLRWLVVHHRFGFATALIDARTQRPVEYLAVDPTGAKARAR